MTVGESSSLDIVWGSDDRSSEVRESVRVTFEHRYENGYQRVENQTVEFTNQSTTKESRLPISRKHLYKFINTKQSIFIKHKFRLFGSH